jgi:hypothetical protein
MFLSQALLWLVAPPCLRKVNYSICGNTFPTTPPLIPGTSKPLLNNFQNLRKSQSKVRMELIHTKRGSAKRYLVRAKKLPL